MAIITDIIPNIINILIIIQKFFLKSFKTCRSIKLIRFLKLLSTIVFINQTILLTIKYLKYETVIDLKLMEEINKYSPAFSLCLRSKLFGSDFGNSTISDYIGKVTCEIFINGKCMFEFLKVLLK